MGRDLDRMEDFIVGFNRSTFSKPNTEFSSDLSPCDLWAFPTMKREFRGKKFRSDQLSAARFREVGGVFEEIIACQGSYFEKETVTAPPQSSDSK
jgi:hypothetical protein